MKPASVMDMITSQINIPTLQQQLEQTLGCVTKRLEALESMDLLAVEKRL